jgi:predicted transcriptional regulator
VVDSQGHLDGWVSEQDCIAVMLKEAYHCEQVAQVRDVMRKEVLAVGPDTSILDLAEMMMGQKPKIYPVVEEGRLLGVISRHDVMQAIHAQLAPASCAGQSLNPVVGLFSKSRHPACSFYGESVMKPPASDALAAALRLAPSGLAL